MNKCKLVASALEWEDKVWYFDNSTVHWSPWLSKLGITLENPKWREVDRKLNNKDLVQLNDLWDDSRSQWLDIDMLRQCHSLSLFEDVLVNRLF